MLLIKVFHIEDPYTKKPLVLKINPLSTDTMFMRIERSDDGIPGFVLYTYQNAIEYRIFISVFDMLHNAIDAMMGQTNMFILVKDDKCQIGRCPIKKPITDEVLANHETALMNGLSYCYGGVIVTENRDLHG